MRFKMGSARGNRNLRLPSDPSRFENEFGAVAGVDLVSAAQRLHSFAGSPRLHRVVRAYRMRRSARLAFAFVARYVTPRAFVKIFYERTECWYRRDDDTEIVFDRRPQDQRRAVRVVH